MKGPLLKKARVSTTQHFLTHDYRDVERTLDEMDRDFGRRRLVTWMLIAKHLGIPRDVARLIASKVPRDYREHPVWSYIAQTKMLGVTILAIPKYWKGNVLI
jgi:hypothetical protein